jgi:hypothetical protein
MAKLDYNFSSLFTNDTNNIYRLEYLSLPGGTVDEVLTTIVVPGSQNPLRYQVRTSVEENENEDHTNANIC